MMKIAQLFCLLFLLVSIASADPPSKVFDEYKKAGKAGKIEAAWNHIVTIDGLPTRVAEHLKSKTVRFSKMFQEGWDINVLDEKELNNVAVLVADEVKSPEDRSLDVDPIYLLKQNGAWKLMPNFSSWDAAKRFFPDTVDDFQKLEKWYENRKRELKSEGSTTD